MPEIAKLRVNCVFIAAEPTYLYTKRILESILVLVNWSMVYSESIASTDCVTENELVT